MAKCIRVVGQGIPVRMTDAEAFQIVDRDSDGEYCSKSFWREWHAKGEHNYKYSNELKRRMSLIPYWGF